MQARTLESQQAVLAHQTEYALLGGPDVFVAQHGPDLPVASPVNRHSVRTPLISPTSSTSTHHRRANPRPIK